MVGYLGAGEPWPASWTLEVYLVMAEGRGKVTENVTLLCNFPSVLCHNEIHLQHLQLAGQGSPAPRDMEEGALHLACYENFHPS